MNVLFVSMAGIGDLDDHSIYGDLLKTFKSHGHEVYSVNPAEKRAGKSTELFEQSGIHVLNVRTGNLQKCGLAEKAISQMRLESQFLKAIRKYYSGVKFDLILFPTPPTTLGGLVSKLKKEHGAKSYLLLKDIFPQNSVDLGMLSKDGVKGLIYRYFKGTEEKTYAAADWIGCMSEANVRYLLKYEPQLDSSRIEVNPNSLIPRDMSGLDAGAFREKYKLPTDETIFVYGGNLGKPQSIDFFIEALRLNEGNPVGTFVIAGKGTERHKLENYFSNDAPVHAVLLPSLPRAEYDAMLCACDVGLILLDYRFTIPNFPSRLLSYMQASMPVVTATDTICDMGELAETNGFGLSGSSDNPKAFLDKCKEISESDYRAMGKTARSYMEAHFSSEISYDLIARHFDD